jgi:signal transduction histidine kinase
MAALSVAPHARYPRLPAVAIPVRLETDPASAARQIPPRPRRACAGFKMRNRLSLLVRQPATLDIGLAVLLAGLSVLAVWRLIDPAGLDATKLKLQYEFGAPQLQYWRTLCWLAAVGVELGVLPVRRRLPVTVLAVTLAMAAAHSLLLPGTATPADLAVALVVYTLASARSRLVSAGAVIAGLAIATGLYTLLLAVTSPGTKAVITFWPVKPASLAVPVLVLAAAWLAGDSVRTRRAYIAEVERRAADAERDLVRQAELAAAAERERITRELHDVIAHALSVMVIQAQGAGSALRRRRPAETGEALDAIVTTGRGALAETRRLLGVVRRPADAEPELAPQPGLGDLPALAARVRRAGTPVQLRVTGTVRPLADGVELSAYRIIQEALTNTMKDAGRGATAAVGVHYAATELTVEITDDGDRGVPGDRPERPGNIDAERAVVSRARDGVHGRDDDAPGGHGLAGMQARVAMLGGELIAGPRNGAGFRVRARLPVAESAVLARGDDPPRPLREGMAPGDHPQPPPDTEPGAAGPVEATVPRSPS